MNYIALLRGINVSGRNKIPMKDLKSICEELECKDARTLLQSGNVCFTSDEDGQILESKLEKAIQTHFQLEIPVIIRTAEAWEAYLRLSPVRQQAETDPSRVLLYLSKQPMLASAETSLRERANAKEFIAVQQDALWIHYPQGVGRSKLTPNLIDRAVGSPATGRNWNTIRKLADLVQGS